MNDSSILCPLCGEGRLVEHTHERHLDVDGHAYVVSGLRHSLCSHCGEDITTPEQSRYNKRTIIEARHQAVAARDQAQRLTADDILRIRKKIGVTQVQAARVFGGGPNAFTKYEHAEVAPSDGMEKLLRLADSVPEAANWLLRRAGLPASQMVEPPCHHTKSCVVLQRLRNESMRTTWPAAKGADAAKLTRFHAALSCERSFTYSTSMAANDSHDTPAPEFQAAVG